MPSSRDHPYPGIEPTSPASLALSGRFFTTSAIWEVDPAITKHSKFPLLYLPKFPRCVTFIIGEKKKSVAIKRSPNLSEETLLESEHQNL